MNGNGNVIIATLKVGILFVRFATPSSFPSFKSWLIRIANYKSTKMCWRRVNWPWSSKTIDTPNMILHTLHGRASKVNTVCAPARLDDGAFPWLRTTTNHSCDICSFLRVYKRVVTFRFELPTTIWNGLTILFYSVNATTMNGVLHAAFFAFLARHECPQLNHRHREPISATIRGIIESTSVVN